MLTGHRSPVTARIQADRDKTRPHRPWSATGGEIHAYGSFRAPRDQSAAWLGSARIGVTGLFRVQLVWSCLMASLR